MLKGWAEAVDQATSGRVKVEILSQAVAPAPEVLDAIRAAKADVSVMSNGAHRTPLPLNALVEFAGQTSSAERSSVAYQHVFSRYPAMAEEFAGVEVLSVFTHGPGALLLSSRKTVDDTGLPKAELHAGSSGAADAVRALGANPTVAPGPGAKPLLAAGKVEGTVTSIEAIDGFGLAPQINQISMMRGGLYSAGFSLIFNKSRWDALKPEDRAAIMRISGESLARLAGRAWDAADTAAVDAARSRGVLISALPDAVEQRVRSDSSSRQKAWISAQGILSIDAKNALDEYRSELNELASAPPAPR